METVLLMVTPATTVARGTTGLLNVKARDEAPPAGPHNHTGTSREDTQATNNKSREEEEEMARQVVTRKATLPRRVESQVATRRPTRPIP
ncbi:MAG: hypothetical protein MJE68_07910 [Proteobacteria bacterium]|nr:hypothetical protein [Pseudomonadota bacterium]